MRPRRPASRLPGHANFDSSVFCPSEHGSCCGGRADCDQSKHGSTKPLDIGSPHGDAVKIDHPLLHTEDVQCAHLVALSGIVDRHNGQSFVVAAAGAVGFFSRFICLTSMKMTNAMMMKSNTVWRNTP